MPTGSETLGERSSDRRAELAAVAAATLGLVVPMLVLGRTALAVTAAVAILGLLAGTPRGTLARGINDAMRTPLGGMVWLTFGLWLVSVAGSVELGRSIPVWLRMVALLLAGAAVCAALRARPGLPELALRALVAGACGCALVALAALTIASDPYVWLMGHGDERAIVGIAATLMKSYGTAVALVMPAALWAGFRLGGPWRLPAVLFQGLAVVILAILQSRAGLVAGGLGLGLLGAWYALRHRRGWLLLLLVPVVVAALAGAFLDNQRNNRIEPALGVPEWLVDGHRQAIWAFSLGYVRLAPWFGTGQDTINFLPGADDIVPGSDATYVPSHPHNFMVEVLVETGAVGFGAMMATLLLLAAGLVRTMRRDGAVGATLLAVSLVYWVVNMISYSFWSYWWQASWVLVMALVASTATPGLVSGGFRGPRR